MVEGTHTETWAPNTWPGEACSCPEAKCLSKYIICTHVKAQGVGVQAELDEEYIKCGVLCTYQHKPTLLVWSRATATWLRLCN